MKTIILMGVMAFASASAWAAPVFVEAKRLQNEDIRTERVSFADLDLSSKSALGTLKSRIHSVANRVCVSDIAEPLQASLESTSCYRRAVDDSYAQIDKILAARKAGTAIAAATVSVSAHR